MYKGVAVAREDAYDAAFDRINSKYGKEKSWSKSIEAE